MQNGIVTLDPGYIDHDFLMLNGLSASSFDTI